MRIIGIAGRAGSGKDTLAKGLNMYLVNSAVEHFADDVKAMVHSMFDIPADHPKHEKLPGQVFTLRQLYQRFGTECMRGLDEDYWVKRLFAKLDTGLDHVMIADVRFENEARAILKRGGIVVEVQRPGLVQAPEHISEKPLPRHLINFEIQNTMDTPHVFRDYATQEVLKFLPHGQNRPADTAA